MSNEAKYPDSKLEGILEACLMSSDKPLSAERLQSVFIEDAKPGLREIKKALAKLEQAYVGRATELVEVASGWRFQVKEEYSTWVGRLFAEKPPKYGRAFLETLAIIAYRQPVTRGEIEEIRGVTVSSNIMRSLLERDWVKVVGHKEVPGRPAMFATTKGFLDYFNLASLDQLPDLVELQELADINVNLKLPSPDYIEEEPLSDGTEALDEIEELAESERNPLDAPLEDQIDEVLEQTNDALKHNISNEQITEE